MSSTAKYTSKMFILYSGLPEEIKADICQKLKDRLIQLGDDSAEAFHLSTGISIVCGNFTDTLGEQIKSEFPQIRAIQPNRRYFTDSTKPTPRV